MTKEQANRLLDEVKDGNSYLSVKRITEALWTTGDAVRPVPIHPRPFSQDGINEWLESTCMAQSTGTGEPLLRDLSGNKSGIDKKDEGNQ